MNNDNIIEESIQKMKAHVMWRDNDQSMLENRLRELMLEADQAGYERGMGEAKKWVEEELADIMSLPHGGATSEEQYQATLGMVIKLKDMKHFLSSLTPTDNNKEDIQAELHWNEELRRKVGFMRQWLNEDRITDPKKMVTTEELLHWLSNNTPSHE